MENKVRIYREGQGYTLQELADLCGSSKSYIWELENGRATPSIRLAYAISTALGEDDVKMIFPDDQKYEEVVVKKIRKTA